MRTPLNFPASRPRQADSNQPRQAGLVGLLGAARARVVELLRPGPASVAELADRLGVSEPAVRRHLRALEREGLVEGHTVRKDRPGRPGTRYTLTHRARALYPDRSADFANDLLDYLEAEHGRSAFREFLRWRQRRQSERYAEALDGIVDPAERTERLAELLSEDGFLAETSTVATPDGATVLQLSQGHCAIAEVAAAHPEICAYEAALFRDLLGVSLSRRQTIAGGASACLCTISPNQTTSTGAVNVHEG